MARRVFSGFITTPAGSSWAAQRVTGASQNEGEEDVGPATVAARQVAVQVAGASGIIWAATRDWRLHGGAPLSGARVTRRARARKHMWSRGGAGG